MAKWGVKLTWGDGDDYVSDDTFKTKKAAMAEGEYLMAGWSQGNEDQLLSNPGDFLSEYGSDPIAPDIEVFKIDD